jgi:hypothetical protein
MSNETQQTAVDQIVNLLNKEGFAPVLTQEEIKFFKEMEKEQIIKSMGIAFNDALKIQEGKESIYNDWEQYYQETYGGDK